MKLKDALTNANTRFELGNKDFPTYRAPAGHAIPLDNLNILAQKIIFTEADEANTCITVIGQQARKGKGGLLEYFENKVMSVEPLDRELTFIKLAAGAVKNC